MKDYTDYNYTDLVNKITSLYEDEVGSGNGYEGSSGQMLIELLADTTDNLHFMLERRAQEAFLESARLQSSIWYHASSVGYRPRRKVSSRGTLELVIRDGDGNEVSPKGFVRIEKGDTVKFDGIEYTVEEDIVIGSTESRKTLFIKEGKPVEKSFNLSDPALNGEILIEDYISIENESLVVSDSMDDKYFDVRDPNSGYINVTSLNFAPSDAKLYDIKYSNEGMRIVFGDGEFGFLPSGTVTLRWIESSGSEASFVAAGREFKFETDSLQDEATPDEYSYSLINTTPVRGGKDEEEPDSIKLNAPSYVRSANRAVTSDDYRFWVRSSGIGDIVDLNVYSEHNTKTIIYTMNNVFVTYLTSDNVPLNLANKKALRDFIGQYKTITNHIIIDEANKVNLSVQIRARKSTKLPVTREHFYNIIKGLTESYLAVEEGAIGRDFQHSEFIEYMQGSTYRIDGVSYKVFDFIYADVEAEYEMSTPPDVYEVSIELLPSYTVTAGDSLTVSIDGTEYTTPINTTQRPQDIMRNLRAEVFENSSMLVALDGTTLFIRSPSETGSFTFGVVDTGSEVNDHVETSIVYNIPRSSEEVSLAIQPKTAYIMSGDRSEILYQDTDGDGFLKGTGDRSDLAIDYAAAKIFGSIFSENAILRYQQNDLKNFKGDQATAVLLAPFNEDYTQMESGASTVKIIEGRG